MKTKFSEGKYYLPMQEESMQVRFHNSQEETRHMNTEKLRENFLVNGLMQEDMVKLVYSHYDRMIIGGIKPVQKKLSLPIPAELRAGYFLERRELGIINVGAKGVVTADGKKYELNKLDGLYLGRGTKKVSFASGNKNEPAVFYLLSAPAHHTYANRLMKKEKASPTGLGETASSNKRTVYKYIHPGGIKSCQLVMGLTVLEHGSVWNSVPPHTHTRRMEVYFYFDVPEGQSVFHFMGQPFETRHLVMANHEAVISPPWSTHFGCGTSHYGFIWGMAGENQVYTDMDVTPVNTLK